MTIRAALLAILILGGCAPMAHDHVVYAVDALTFTAPTSWQEETPASPSRRAQFALPGDAGEASLVVYYFGEGTAGSVEANVERWAGQFEGVDPVVRMRTINGLTVHTVDVAGRYVAQITPGSDERHDEPGYAMRAAIVETPAGPYYLKAVGPASTIAAQEAGLTTFIEQVAYDATRAAPADMEHP